MPEKDKDEILAVDPLEIGNYCHYTTPFLFHTFFKYSSTFLVDEKVPRKNLIYEGTMVQKRTNKFLETNLCCCICQQNFTTIVAFEDHIERHGVASNYELAGQLTKL